MIGGGERVDIIKRLRQGDGMTLEKVQDLNDDALMKFNYGAELSSEPPTPEAVFNLIRWSALSLLDDQYSLAIRNALAIGQGVGQGNLTERRMHLLEQIDVSLRTLITYEDTGAELLAKQIDMTGKMRQDLGTVDVSDLAVRLAKLEAMVKVLGERVDTLAPSSSDESAFIELPTLDGP